MLNVIINMDRKYTINQAAKILKISEDEVRCAIGTGEIQATIAENLADYVIHEDEIKRFGLSITRSFSMEKKRVLIIEDEINFANLMKLELSRDPRVDSRFATWGKDGIALVKTFKPHVLVVDFMLPDMKATDVLNSLESENILEGIKVIVYSAHIQYMDESVAKRLQFGIIDKTKGMRNILVKIYELLGIVTTLKAK